MHQQGFEQRLIGIPGEQRRKRITFIVAYTIIAGCTLVLATILYYSDGESIQQLLAYPEVRRLSVAGMVGLFASGTVLFLLHKTRLVTLSGILITLAFIVLVMNADDLAEIANGRSVVYLVIPVLLAAITIRPYAAFITAGTINLFFLLNPVIQEFNLYAFGGVWAIAFYIWLATAIMEKAIDTAQQETQRVRAMLGIVSHELRTPLGSISGYLDLLLIGKSADSAQFEMLARAKISARALIALVNRLLDSAHIQSGKLDLKSTPTLTKNIFEPIIRAAEKQAKEKGLKFQVDIHNLPDSIVVDSLRLQQIIANLLDNAVKYTGSGKVSLEVAGLGNKMQIIVRDTGDGIAPENIRMIFQEFSQVQHYATRDQGGVGLGLYIVHSLVNLMGGVIRVESKMGKGSAFIVTLPLLISN
jgi:signal transduction histidine kinase